MSRIEYLNHNVVCRRKIPLQYLFLRYASHNGVQFTKTQDSSPYTQADASQVLHTKEWRSSPPSGDIVDTMLDCTYSLNHVMPIDASGNITGEMVSPVYGKVQGPNWNYPSTLGYYNLQLKLNRYRGYAAADYPWWYNTPSTFTITDSWQKYTRGGVDRDYIYTLAKVERITALVPRCPFKMSNLMFRYAITSEAQTKKDCADVAPNLHTVNPAYDKAITDAKTLYKESLPDTQDVAFWSDHSSAHILDDNIVLPSKGTIENVTTSTIALQGYHGRAGNGLSTYFALPSEYLGEDPDPDSIPPFVFWTESEYATKNTRSNFNGCNPTYSRYSDLAVLGGIGYWWFITDGMWRYERYKDICWPMVLPVHEYTFDLTHPEIENVVEYYYSSEPITTAEIHDDYDYETVLTDPRWKKLELPEGTTDDIYAMIIKSTFRKGADGYVNIVQNDSIPFYSASITSGAGRDKFHIWEYGMMANGHHPSVSSFISLLSNDQTLIAIQPQWDYFNPPNPFTNLRSNNSSDTYYADDPLPYGP